MTPPSYPYAKQRPSPQQTLNLFQGEWASRFPSPLDELEAGPHPLFEDPRISWADQNLQALGGGLAGRSVLELGPLDGGHTYALSRFGARSVTAIEAHRGAFLRCLVAKELTGMERVNFLYGDAVEYLRAEDVHFDVGVASGFLYHMVQPVELIRLLCLRCDAVFLWTVYWTRDYGRAHPELAKAKTASHQIIHEGFQHTLHRHSYGDGFNYATFLGGSAPYANWMEGEEILAAFRHFGLGRLRYEWEENPMGPALRLVACR